MKKLTAKEFKKYLDYNDQLRTLVGLTATTLIVIDKLKIPKEEELRYLKVANKLMLDEINKHEKKIEHIRSEMKIASLFKDFI